MEEVAEAKVSHEKMMSNMPTNYHKMKSGTQLHQVYRDVVRDHWKADYVSLCRFVLNSLLLTFRSNVINSQVRVVTELTTPLTK